MKQKIIYYIENNIEHNGAASIFESLQSNETLMTLAFGSK